MSETSSDAELSCGWTIISNEGSDIETLGSEAVGEYGAELLERPALEESQPLESRASASAGTNLALHVEENAANSLDDALGEQPGDETLQGPETGDGASVGVFSSSDHSDIVTLRDLEEGQHAEEEEVAAAAAASSTEELYLGTSSSSHYTFTASEIAFLAQHPAATSSSSSEDEVVRSSSPIVRRRRVRKNTPSTVTDPEDEEEVLPESRCGDEEVKEEQHQADGVEVRLDAAHEGREQGRGGSVLNKCILLALIIAVSMGFGHFYGTVQTEERQKTAEKTRGIENADVRELLMQHVRDQHLTKQGSDFGQDDFDEQQIIHLLSEVIDRVMQENQELKAEHVRIQVQRDDLEEMLKQAKEDRTNIMSQQQSLTDDNAQLRSSLERQETSLTILQEELRILRSEIQDLEARGAEADSLLSENQRLKEQMEEEQQMIRDFHVQREDMTAELHMLRRKLEIEGEVTEELRGELSVLRSHVSGKDGGTEAEDLEKRMMELEKRLSFEQQRSDLWERLYVETKEEKAKGDREPKTKRPKEGMAGKVKETFDAVKNSTKEFVHHHKEQIKKAKEAVKENLRKFSDSVKSTFRHFKDSASTFINKARGFYNKKCDKTNTGEPWQRRTQKPQNDHNTRKSAGKVLEDQDEGNQRSSVKGCSGVFDCAYQESMSLFNKAAEPIRADEFNLLLQSYLQREVGHFYHWSELGTFINGFFHDGLFIHDRMLFTDFVSRVENYLAGMHEYHGLDDDVFGDLDDYIYRHFFGEGYTKSYGPRHVTSEEFPAMRDFNLK
ncbi:cell cycle progression protein 1 isoform 2-T2 [Fundulus diaphanus]